MTLKVKALLIGLNYSNVANEHALTGCVNDVHNMKAFLDEMMKDTNYSIKVITDEDPDNMDRVSWSGIVIELFELCVSSWRDDLDRVIFHYSGHGRQMAELSSGGYNTLYKTREEDGLDEGIVPVDYGKYGIIRDDMLNSIFTRFNPKTRILCIFDCCHSGSILDLKYQWGFSGLLRSDSDNDDSLPWIICFSAARDQDIAGEVHKKTNTGAFTTNLLEYFRKHGTAENILKMQKTINVELGDEGYDQIHVISSTRNIHMENSLKEFLL